MNQSGSCSIFVRYSQNISNSYIMQHILSHACQAKSNVKVVKNNLVKYNGIIHQTLQNQKKNLHYLG